MQYEYICPLAPYENIHLTGDVDDADIKEKMVELANIGREVRERLGIGVRTEETIANPAPKVVMTPREVKTEYKAPGKGQSLNRALTSAEYAKFRSRVETETDNDFIQDVAKKLEKYGSLSPKQIEAVLYPKPRAKTSQYAEEQ